MNGEVAFANNENTWLDPKSRDRMGPHLIDFFPGDTLFHRVARAVCRAGCLPRKELYESWEVARRTRRRFRGGRVVDLCCGHGLVAHLMLLLDGTSGEAIAVDHAIPPSGERLSTVLCADWPKLAGRVRFVAGDALAVPLQPTDLVVSSHACGTLTDRILDRVIRASARVAILPCCHDIEACDHGGLGGWIDLPLAIDVTRAHRLRSEGYTVYTQRIPPQITPQNRLLLAVPNAPHGRA